VPIEDGPQQDALAAADVNDCARVAQVERLRQQGANSRAKSVMPCWNANASAGSLARYAHMGRPNSTRSGSRPVRTTSVMAAPAFHIHWLAKIFA